MQNFLKRFLLFTGIVLLTYIGGINLWDFFVPQPYKPNILYKVGDGLVSMKVKESDTLEDLDILFLGSSHAYVAFDPRIYDRAGLKTFNWGTTKQTHIQTRLIMDAYLDKLNPKLVVYEVFPEIFALDGIESTIDFLNSNRSFNQNMLDYIFEENGLKVFNTFIIKYTRQNLFRIDDSFKDQNQYSKLSYVPGGYVESNWKNPYTLTEDQRETFLNIKWEPKDEQMQAFEENIQILRDKKIPYILVIAPYVFKYQNQMEISEYFKDKGVFYNYNNIMEFREDTDFSDFHHLNNIGAKKMNLHLIKEIKVHFSVFEKSSEDSTSSSFNL